MATRFTPRAPHASGHPTWRDLLAVAAGLAVALSAALWPLTARLGARMVAPFGDPLLNAWTLAWGADRLRHGLRGFWSAPFFYPARDVLAYSEHLLGVSVFTAPLQWLTGNPVLVYNVAWLGSAVLAGVGMFLLASELTRHRGAAVVAAVAFAFAPYRVSQLTHLQVLACGWMPIALWGLHRYLHHGTRRALAVFAVAFVLQAWSNGYFLYFLAVPAAMTAAHGLWTCRAAWRQRAAGLVAAAVAILLALAPVAAAYLRVRREHGFRRSLADLVQYSAVPYSFVTVSPDLWWWGRVLPEAVAERALFPGLVVLALALLGVWTAARKRNLDAADRTVVWLYAAIVALAVSLSFGPQPALWGTWRLPTGPYAWAAAVVPGMDGLRVPARVGVVVALGLSVLAGFGARAIGARARTPGVRAALFAGMAGLLYLEGLPVPVQPTAVPTSDMEHDAAAYQWLRAQPSGAVLEMPVGAPEHETRYVYATLAHGHRSVNGYSGYGTALHEFLSGPPTREPASAPALLALLRQLGVRYVVFHGELYGDAAFAETVRNALLEASAASAVPGTTTTFGATDIFEVRGAAPRPPPEAPAPQGCRLPSRAFSLDASDNREALERLVDGVRGSRWLTGRPQRGDEWISVTLDRSRVVTGVRLVMDRYSFGDYPRGLLLEGSANGVAFAPLWSGSGLGPLGLSLGSSPHAPRIDLRFPPAEVRALRLRQTGATPRVWFWSVHELEVWADTCE